MTHATPQLHPLPEIAHKYQLNLRSLRERARRREFTHIRIGRERYLTDEQLAALLAGYTVTSERVDELAKRTAELAATHDRVTRRRRKAA